MEILEVLAWIVGVLVVIGVLVGIAAFFGLRKLWRYVDERFTEEGRPGPGRPPMSRDRPRRTTAVRDVRDPRGADQVDVRDPVDSPRSRERHG